MMEATYGRRNTSLEQGPNSISIPTKDSIAEGCVVTFVSGIE
jgi:hypothetical protein